MHIESTKQKSKNDWMLFPGSDYYIKMKEKLFHNVLIFKHMVYQELVKNPEKVDSSQSSDMEDKVDEEGHPMTSAIF